MEVLTPAPPPMTMPEMSMPMETVSPIQEFNPATLEGPIHIDLLMPEVPMLREVDGDLYATALHEGKHAALANRKGVLEGISMTRMGDSLARTYISSSVSREDFQIIAMGGTHDTPAGRAEGYGSDVLQALHVEAETGISAQYAKSAGEEEIKGMWIDPKVEEIVGEIIAYKQGFISPNMYRNIVRRAEQEYKIMQLAEQGIPVQINTPDVIEEPRQEEFLDEEKFLEPGEYHVISGGADGSWKHQYVIIDESHDKWEKCAFCMVIGGHTPNCAFRQNPEGIGKPGIIKDEDLKPFENKIDEEIKDETEIEPIRLFTYEEEEKETEVGTDSAAEISPSDLDLAA